MTNDNDWEVWLEEEAQEEKSHRPPHRERPKYGVLYEDERIIAFDKAAGVPSIRERFDIGTSLKEIAEERFGRLWTVHRIDKGTSGVIVFARDAEAHKSLNDQFEAGTVDKRYLAVVEGTIEDDVVEIDLPLMPDPKKPGRMKASAAGKPSHTTVRVLERFRGYTLIEAQPHTGRQHQIRVHCAGIGHPLLVDPAYGKREQFMLSELKRKYKDYGREEKPLVARLTLHAQRLIVTHPGTGEPITFEAPVPRDLHALISQLRKLRAVG